MPHSDVTPSGRRRLRILIRVVVPVLFAAGLTYTFTEVIRFGYVVSSSMEPTLHVGDYYLIDLTAFRDGSGPRRGDIVVYRGPDDAPYVKRVIALPGDVIGVWFGRVWLNGRWLQEGYVDDSPVFERPLLVEVPDKSFFVLGDNRAMSEDSRDYGPVSYDRLLGRVTCIVWPRSRARVFRPIEYE